MRIKGGVRDKVKHKIAVKNITEDARLKPRNSRNIPFILSTTFVFLPATILERYCRFSRFFFFVPKLNKHWLSSRGFSNPVLFLEKRPPDFL